MCMFHRVRAEVEGQLSSHVGLQRSNSGHLVAQQSLLPSEPACQPEDPFQKPWKKIDS